MLALCAATFLMAGCAATTPQKDVSIAELEKTVEATIDFDTSAMHTADREYMLMLLEVDGEAISDFVMKIPTGTNQNEYGVFVAAPDRESEVEDAVNKYLQTRKEEWDVNYLAEEKFKIDSGRCGRIGPYVYYVIGGDNFDQVEKAITGIV
jgi:hypothetical protein